MTKRRGIRFSGKSLELGKKYMWRRESIPLLYKYLDIHPRQRIVDVGCGTGFLSRLVAKALKGNGEVLGIDRNPQLLRYATRITREAGLDSLVSFQRGDATRLKLEDNYAERVICQAVLWTITDPKKAIGEMIRVCKPGGIVGAIEGAFDTAIFYYPGNEHLSELSSKIVRAQAKGTRRLQGLDGNIGYKLPSLFQECGLERIRLDGYARVWLGQDDRIPLEHKVKLHRNELDELRRRASYWTETFKAGGMNEDEIREQRELHLTYLKRLLRKPESFKADSSVNAGIFFIATGIKPRDARREAPGGTLPRSS